MRRPGPSLGWFLSYCLVLAGCGQAPPLAIRVPREGTVLRILPGAHSEAAQAAASRLAQRLALVDAEGRVRGLTASPEGVEVQVRPGMTLRLVDGGAAGVVVVEFAEGQIPPAAAPESMERGVAAEGGTFFVERAGVRLALRPAGAGPDTLLIEAVPILEGAGFAVYFAAGAAAGRYEKISAAGSAQFLGMLQSDNLGHEYMWSGFLVTMLIVTAVLVAGFATDWGRR